MKRAVALIFLVIFLFNLGGYIVLFKYFIYRSDNVLNEQISINKYKTSELVEIKIPVKLPDVYNWDTYELVSGQVQLNHNCYNYVKLKITKDTLYLMCIPNYEKTRLINANIIYAKQVSDNPLSKRSHTTFIKIPETYTKYNHQVAQHQFLSPFSFIQKATVYIHPSLDHPFIAARAKPPQTGC